MYYFVDATSFLIKFGKLRQKNKRKIWKVVKPKAFMNDALIKLLMKLKDPNCYKWLLDNLWTETESLRYSAERASAYNTLRRVLKYHWFEKKDGGIINCIKKEDDSIETEPNKVNELLLTTMKDMQIDEKWEFLEEKDFPKLNRLSQGDMEIVLRRLSTGKVK